MDSENHLRHSKFIALRDDKKAGVRRQMRNALHCYPAAAWSSVRVESDREIKFLLSTVRFASLYKIA